MMDLSFKTEYVSSVMQTPLPEGYRIRLLENLKAQALSEEKEPLSRKTARRVFISLIAACLVAVVGVGIFSSLAPVYEEVTLKVFSADTVRALSGARISFRDSSGEYLKNPEGEPLTAVTDETGAARVSLPKYTDYTAEINLDGYISYADKAKSGNYYVSPILDENTFRAVLTWDEDLDLDAHLSYTQNGITEKLFYFSSDIEGENGQVIAALDTDSAEKNKPETITFNAEGNEVFRFTVCSYSALENKESLSIKDAKAKVTLYKGDKILSTYELSGEGSDNAWQVFEIENGVVKEAETTYSVGSFYELR